MKSLVLRPHAKINLGLRILGQRLDRYHAIRTRFQTIDLLDEMEISTKPRGLDLTVEGARLPSDSSNLVLKAAMALQEGRRGLPGARFHVRKRIPLAAGLGGGSSDAAAALLGLNRLWNLDLDALALAQIGSRLGADVPFFLHGGTALGSGRGDRIQPLPDLPPYTVCLLLPPFAASTAEIYRLWDEQHPSTAASPGDEGRVEEAGLAEVSRETIFNDLQEPLFSRHPPLRGYLERLYSAGARAASVSGSGPCLYGLFTRATAARLVGKAWDWGDVRVICCARVPRAEYGTSLGILPPPGDSLTVNSP